MIKVLTIFIGGLTLTGLAFSTSAIAADILVTTANVKVRATPDGQQTDSLKAGTAVALVAVSGSWAKVMYIDPPGTTKARSGWVSIAYVSRPRGKRTRNVSGDDCDSESETGAEVCVRATNASLDCQKSFAGEYYSGCEATLEYEVETDYDGDSYLDVGVECKVEITYSGRNTFVTQDDSDSQDDSHDLYAGDSDSGSMSFDFSFSSFQEVTRARIESATCEIDDVYLQ